MSLPQVARRYARALFETARDADDLASTGQDMETLAALFASLPEVLAWCRAGAVHRGTAVLFVRTAFLPYVGERTGTVLLLAAQNGRLEILPLLPLAFGAVADQEGPGLRLLLETAQTPEPGLVEQVAGHWSAITGRQAQVTVSVVPELVAGFRVFWRDRLADRSAKGRLHGLRSQLAPRSVSHER